MEYSLSGLIDYYLETAFRRKSKLKQETLTILTEYQANLDRELYENLNEVNFNPRSMKCDTEGSVDLETNFIQDDLVAFVKEKKSSITKRERLQCILEFWTYLHQHQQIPGNPVGEILKRGDKNIKALVLRLIPDSTTLRQVDLLKLIQDPDQYRTKQDLSDLLFVSLRTIESDLDAINKHQGLWQYVNFNRIRSWDSKTGAWEHDGHSQNEENYAFSLHPFFTVLPLDAIAGLLQGIEVLRKEKHPHLLAFDWLTIQLCDQLSPYARKRLEALGYDLPSANLRPVIVSEMAYNAETIERPLAHAFKSGDKLFVTWNEDDQSFTEKVRVVDYPQGETVLLDVDGKRMEIPKKNIAEVEALYPHFSRQGPVLRKYRPAEQEEK